MVSGGLHSNVQLRVGLLLPRHKKAARVRNKEIWLRTCFLLLVQPWGLLQRATHGSLLEMQSPGFSVDDILSLLNFLGCFFT